MYSSLTILKIRTLSPFHSNIIFLKICLLFSLNIKGGERNEKKKNERKIIFYSIGE
jgi:hypothetical protein